jgi:hypothetical protein
MQHKAGLESRWFRQVADLCEEVYQATGNHGCFRLGHVVSMPGDLAAIVDLLVPEPQRRRRFRRECNGTTLHDNLFDDDEGHRPAFTSSPAKGRHS